MPRDTVEVEILAETKKSIDGIKKFAIGVGVATVAIRSAIRAVKGLVDAFREQEMAETRLKAAIMATGRQTDISNIAMQKFASELQKVTTFGDEVTLSAAAMLQQLADLDQDGLTKLLPLVQDFATGMGVDLVTAANLVGKTVGSTTNALSRYGIVIDATADKTTKIDQLTVEMTAKFGGMSKAMADTASGSMKQFSNALGDLQEKGGGVILNFLKPAIVKLTEFVTQLNYALESINKLNDLFTETGRSAAGESIPAIRDAMQTLAEEIDRVRDSLAKGMPIGGRTRKETEEYIVTLQNKYEGLRRELVRFTAVQKENTEATKEQTKAQKEQKEEAEKITAQDPTGGTGVFGGTGGRGGGAGPVSSFQRTAKAAQETDKAIRELTREGIGPMNTAFQRTGEIAGETDRRISYLAEVFENLQLSIEDFSGAFVTGFGSIGAALAGAMPMLDAFKQLFKDFIASALMAMGKQLLTQAALLFTPIHPFNPPAGVAALVGAGAAFAAAGFVRALGTGGIVTQPTLAMVGERGPEAVIPLTGNQGFGGATIIVQGSVVTEEEISRVVMRRMGKFHRGY